MNKRGQSELFDITMVLFEIVLAITIGAALFGFFIKPLNESTYFDKLAITTDMGLLMTIINTIPSNIAYYYNPISLNRFWYQLGSDIHTTEVISTPTGEQHVGDMRSSYASSSLYNLNTGILSKPQSIFFLKNGKSITITPTKDFATQPLLAKQRCPIYQPTAAIIDPGHGGLSDGLNKIDTGEVQGPSNEAEITRKIVSLGKFGNFPTTRDTTTDQYISPAARIATIQQAKLPLISIHTGSISYSAVIYIDATSSKASESAALACNIINSLSDIEGLAHTAIVPIDPSHLELYDTRHILEATPVGVYIELGSMDTPIQTTYLQQHAAAFGTAIRHATEALQ